VKKNYLLFLLLLFSISLFGEIKEELHYPADMKYFQNRDFQIVEYQKQYYVNEVWQDSLRYYYQYDDELIQIIYQQMVGGNFERYGKLSYIYDENDLLSNTIYSYYENDDWINYYQYSYYYNEDDNIVSNVYSEWIDENWLGLYLGSYSYENGILSEEFWQYWEDENTLINSHQYSYSYDLNNNLTEILYQIWENGTDLVNDNRYVYTYDAMELNTDLLYQIWDNGDWTNSFQYIYLYDQYGNLINSDYQTWVDGWLENSYATYLYDENGKLSQLLWQYWFENKLYNYSRELYTYENFSALENNEIPIVNVRNFPNPFNSETTLYLSTMRNTENMEICIYNIKGQKVRTLPVIQGGSKGYSIWDSKNEFGKKVSSGVYFYQIVINSYPSKRGKMILKR